MIGDGIPPRKPCIISPVPPSFLAIRAPIRKTPGTMNDPAPSDRPIFIVGCARSGTTLLQLMLHSHPRIAIPPETRYIFQAYQRRGGFGDLTKPENRGKLARFIIDRPGTAFGDLGLDAERIRARIIDGPPTIGSAFGIILREYAAARGKPRWGDKRPNYIDRIPILLELFPGAQIVHIIRDGRDCMASLKKMPWWKFGPNTSVCKWIKAIHNGQVARRTLRADQYYEFRYEDLVKNPEPELRRLCGFLNETFSADMLEHHRVASDAVPEMKRNDWHINTTRQINTQAIGRWRKDLEPWELALIETMGRRELLRHRYPLSADPPALPWKRRVDYWRRERSIRRKDDARRRSFEKIHLAHPHPVAARLSVS